MSPTGRLCRLFPDGTSGAEILGFGNAASLHPQEAAYSHSFAAKRVAEFAAGRYCARRALGELGYVDFPLLPKPDRSPDWPAGVVGSITHTGEYCGAVVALSQHFRGIGLDAEIVGRVTADTWPQLFTDEDSAQLAAVSGDLRARLATIMFSAKEAFYKCQFALTRQWVEFRDVSIQLDSSDARQGAFVVRPARTFPLLDSVLPLSGRYLVDEELVLTGVSISA